MENWEICKHVDKIGQIAVYVHPGCPQAQCIKGVLVSTKNRCRHCRLGKGEKSGNTEKCREKA